MDEKVHLSWHDVENPVTKVVMQLETPYDALMVITRGGIIPGGMIAEALKMKNVLTAAVLFPETPGVRAELSWPRFLQFPGDPVLHGRKILIVDNLWDRGRTIVTVKSRVKMAGGFPQTAVLHWKKAHNLFPDEQPDFYGEITDKWIYYPWQRIDDSDDMVPARPQPQLS